MWKTKSILVALGFWVLAGCNYSTSVGEGDAGTTPVTTVTTQGEPDSGTVVVPTPGKRRVFVTSGAYNGNLKTTGAAADGLEGGDNLCMLAAASMNISGTFKAWLSSTTVDAIDRIADVGPWYQIDAEGTATKTFNNKAQLAISPLEHIRITERGDSGPTNVWTGTENGGRKAAVRCYDFTSESSNVYGKWGYAQSSLNGWSAYSDAGCGEEKALYCFEQ